ncbi:MAG: trigger factor [Chlorobiota bacterium]|jgi:trigger factor|nr:MAG: trigger factor [Chlorobiota bacterium]
MQSTLREVSGVKRELDMIISSEETAPHIAQAYHQAQSKVNLKGYRQGRVPQDVIRKLMGKDIDQEAYEKCINQQFASWVESGGVSPIGYPGIVKLDKKLDGGIECTISFEVYPSFSINEYKGISAKRYFHEVTDEDVENEVSRMQESQATFEDTSVIENENHFVKITMTRIDESGNTAEDAVPFPSNLYLKNPKADKKLVDSLIGKNTGDNFTYEVDDKTENKVINFKLEVGEIKKVVLPEVNDELLQKLSGDDKLTLEGFKSEAKRKIDFDTAKYYEELFHNELVAKLVESHKDTFEVPDSVTQQIMMDLVNSKKDKKGELPKGFDIDKFVVENEERARETGRWAIIRDKIIELENIIVEDIDIEDYAEMQAQQYGTDTATLTNFFKENEQVKNQILTIKTLQFLEDNAVIEEVQDTTITNKQNDLIHSDHNHSEHGHSEHDHNHDEENHVH